MFEFSHQAQATSNLSRPAKKEDDLDETEMPFLRGYCNVFAVALHRVTGLPLAATFDIDDWSGRRLLVHAYVKDGDDAIDIRGRFDPSSIEEEFEASRDCWEDEISESDLNLIGSGRRKLNTKSAYYQTAERLAIKLATEMRLPQASPQGIWRLGPLDEGYDPDED